MRRMAFSHRRSSAPVRRSLCVGGLLGGFILAASLCRAQLPAGPSPDPVPFPHFPSTLHAFVWRNWTLVSPERMAAAIDATPGQILSVGAAMGLEPPAPISDDQWRRSYITIIRRNWHLLPYDQLLKLLEWTEDEMAFALREDDFLFVKLGNLKPKCPPLRFVPATEAIRAREAEIAALLRPKDAAPRLMLAHQIAHPEEPLFQFVRDLSAPFEKPSAPPVDSVFSPRYCYSYFALYGDPLIDEQADPYPDNFLARLAAAGVEGVWLQAVLYKLAPFSLQPALSERHEDRIAGLRRLIERAGKHGLRVYLYLNEPRAMPLPFFEGREQIKGTTQGDRAALCTSAPEVQKEIRDAVAHVTREAPGLGGFFSITASENFTNCWSHGRGADCPRCSKRSAPEVIAEVIRLYSEGVESGGGGPRVIAWDWGWADDWALSAIEQLPATASLMSVSEWSLPIERGGVKSAIGEYSISAIGPGPRAAKHWEAARRRGLPVLAKIQAGTTWELGAVPYIPAVENVAKHIANLRAAGVDGLMLGWTLGGYPSPNLEVAIEMTRRTESGAAPDIDEALKSVVLRRFGAGYDDLAVSAWKAMSAAFSQFPYSGGTVYSAPLQQGPSNLLWEKPTGYAATMVGIPYDDLPAWRSIYPAEVFETQLRAVAAGFRLQATNMGGDFPGIESAKGLEPHDAAFFRETDVARAVAIHYESAANQTRFVSDRALLAAAKTAEIAEHFLASIQKTIEAEARLARELLAIQSRDSRIGFEATNHYFYIPMDLAEKILNCDDLLSRWLPAERARPRP